MTEGNDPTSDEKLLAAVAHLFGPLGAIIIWAVQKDKSRFVKFQSIQALAFAAIAMITMMAFFICFFSIAFLGIFSSALLGMKNSSSTENVGIFLSLPFMFPFMVFACTAPFSLALLCFRLIATVSIMNGKNYHYPVLGTWLESFLEER